MNKFDLFMQMCEVNSFPPQLTQNKSKISDMLDSKTIEKIYYLYKNTFFLSWLLSKSTNQYYFVSIAHNHLISTLLTSKHVAAQNCRDSKE